MRTEQREVSTEPDAELPTLDGVTSYQDGDAVVICDKQDPRAWIRCVEPRDLTV